MFSTNSKIYIIVLFIAIILSIFFGFMWHNSSKNLDAVKEDLIEANANIETLQFDLKNFMIYITEKDNKIKELEKKYQDKMNNIPVDKCGDTKPSQELLKYFKEGIK